MSTPPESPLDAPEKVDVPPRASLLEYILMGYHLTWCMLLSWQVVYTIHLLSLLKVRLFGLFGVLMALLAFRLFQLHLQLWQYILAWRQWNPEETLIALSQEDKEASQAAQNTIVLHVFIAVFIGFKNIYYGAGHAFTVFLVIGYALFSIVEWRYIQRIIHTKKQHLHQ